MLDYGNMVENENERRGQIQDEQERLTRRTYGREDKEDAVSLANNRLAAKVAALSDDLRQVRAEAILRSDTTLAVSRSFHMGV